MHKRVFISKPEIESKALYTLLNDKGYELISASFLQFNAVPFKINHPFEVIFFGSPRAVDFFFKEHSLPSTTLIACVGKKTSAKLEQKGCTVHFTGKGANPEEIGLGFKSWCADKRVLFPISDRSLRSISKLFPVDQKEEVITYQTNIVDHSIPPCDFYLFSSPSNVEGFLRTNSLPDNCQVISWGQSTFDYCNEHHINSEMLETPSIDNAIKTLDRLL